MTSNQETATEQLVALLQSVRIANVKVGHLLMQIREGEKYKEEIGQGVDSWYDYLSQPEVGMSVTEANSLIRLHKFCATNFISEHLIARIPTPSMRHLVKNAAPFPMEEILEAGATLSPRDFKDRYYDISTEDTGVRTYTYMVMKKANETGTMEKIHGVESEEIISAFKKKIEENG